jgi:hypothetical protein
VTDVSRCFPSIYTHSIPWALHGKSASKKDRKTTSAKVFGNRLDYIVRQSQDGQTTGVPVGPDHSRVIAEIVLSAVDANFQRGAGDEGFLRHVDDFWIGGTSSAVCEDKLHQLRRSLSEFSLDVNEHKTRIIPTSSIIAETWPYDLEAQLEDALELDATRYEARIVSLLGSIVELASKSQDDGIVKFFLRRIDVWEKWDDYWDVLEPFLAHCGVQFPHSFDYVAQIIAWRARTDREYDRPLWSDVTRNVVQAAGTGGRDAEALWGLWLAKELELKLSVKTYDTMIDSNGPLIAAVLAHFVERGLVRGKPILSELWGMVEGRPISGADWPLSLELNKLEVPVPASIDLGGPEALKSIFDAQASLIDWNAHPGAFIDNDDGFDPNPSSAIEASGSGYEDDEEGGEDDDVPF